jgi:threonine/homoserine/homoserine lactone efflux protein
MPIAEWLSLVLICIIGALSPGPSLAVVMRHSLCNSTKHGLVAAITHGTGVGLYAVMAILGLSSLLTQAPMVYHVLVYAGAAYLLYMGIKALRSKGNSSFKVDTDQQSVSIWIAARDGFAIAFFNPKLAIFFVALFSQFIQPESTGLVYGGTMAMTVFTIDTLWYCIVAGMVHLTKQKFSLASKGQLLDRISGVIFIGLAARVAFI